MGEETDYIQSLRRLACALERRDFVSNRYKSYVHKKKRPDL